VFQERNEREGRKESKERGRGREKKETRDYVEGRLIVVFADAKSEREGETIDRENAHSRVHIIASPLLEGGINANKGEGEMSKTGRLEDCQALVPPCGEGMLVLLLLLAPPLLAGKAIPCIALQCDAAPQKRRGVLSYLFASSRKERTKRK